jgi:hypothetical protein
MKTIANFGILMRLAKELGKAKKSGDKKRIKKAKEDHDAYAKICKEADELIY